MYLCTYEVYFFRMLSRQMEVKNSYKNFILKDFKILLTFCHCCSVTKSRLTLCDPIECSTPGFLVLHYLPEFTQMNIHWVDDAIQLSYPQLYPSLPAFNLSQHQGLFQGVSSSHQVVKVLEFQLQHQSFQWMFRTDFI